MWMTGPNFILNSSVLVIFSTRIPGTEATEREDLDTAVYMISEKASDAILACATAGPTFVWRMVRRVMRRER